MALQLSSTLAAQMLAHAAETPDEEVCGLLFGTVDEIVAVQRARNVSARPAKEFEIDPATLIAAHKAARAGGVPLVGCYHSHPNGVGVPSARDAAAASVGLAVWVILAGNTVTGWSWTGCRFTLVSVSI